VNPVSWVENAAGRGDVLLVCEHASHWIPDRYGDLGVSEADRRRHIAWDVGAAALARGLAARLDARLVLSGVSRLVIDCNRPPGAPSSIPLRSEDTDIPGNAGLTAAEVAFRQREYFEPFRALVAAQIAARRPAMLVGVHSFTPIFRGVARPWHAGVLYAQAQTLGERLVAGLRVDPALVVGANEPYRIEAEEDFTVPVHGDAKGIPAVLLEVRQDLLADEAGAEAWAERLAPLLGAAVAF
jgi:predicted N-formylglutamate amidohydrolase